uniref:SWIM zinc finger domain-containing protein n=1 Tax=Prevotella sp. GTC17254 TaxID=3236794 RepID=A0AB33J0L3_9BACT
MSTATYHYAAPSLFTKTGNDEQLFLAEYSEIRRSQVPCFFYGNIVQPFILARCLVALSKVVQASFTVNWAAVRDPIVTAGNDRLRFEGFSGCAGVYARVDVMPDGHTGEFLDNGTTNVDFNQPMLNALNMTGQNDRLTISVGAKEMEVYTEKAKAVERKVPLPTKWIKGLTTVQIYQSQAVLRYRFSRMQLLQLFQSMPKGTLKTDFYLQIRNGRPVFSPIPSTDAICIGGIHRLRLLEPLLPLADELHIFAHPNDQITIFTFYFGTLKFSLSLSRDCYRGFSGEGAALDSLMDDVPEEWISAIDNYCFSNQQFNADLFAIEHGIDRRLTDQLTTRLAAMGLLGFDLDENSYYYRRLPFKLERIMSLNPRAANAMNLINEDRIQLVSVSSDRVEALVMGDSGVRHTVVLDKNQERCTCQWYSKHQGERGACKHVLAVRKLVGWKKKNA